MKTNKIMNKGERMIFLLFSCLSLFICTSLNAQTLQNTLTIKQDSTINIATKLVDDDHIHDENCNHNHESEYNELSVNDSIQPLYYNLEAPTLNIDTTRIINYWKITERTGEIIPAYPDTFLTDYFNRTNVEGLGTSEAYLGNLGLATESRVFFDRNNRSQFMFIDPFYRYSKTPSNFNFINTKIPHSNISYQRAGSRQVMEERLQAILAINLGKKFNFGFDVDYLYARGYYQSQASKHLEWVFFANYISDRHVLHAFVNPSDYTSAENGGIVDDLDITYPSGDDNTQEFTTNLTNTWNKVKGTQYYLNYRFNLGFDRDTDYTDEDGNVIKQFVPVSSIIYTFNLDDKQKKFYTKNQSSVSNYYKDKTDYFENIATTRDSTSDWNMSNTLGLSLREGFSEWAKFDLTAFITQDFRSFTLMDKTTSYEKNQASTYIGGELAKRKGSILRYNAQGSFGVIGDNIADIDLSGNIETRIPIWGDTASVIGYGSFKNLSPTFYENRYHSKYFWWENDFSKVKKVRFGGKINIPHTNTVFDLGVENITNYIYFNKNGLPTQHGGNIQVVSAQLNQDFQFGALHWDNKLVYQKSSNEKILPLPDFAAYSSLYVQFKVAKVLTIQMGANAHYWTKYYAPSYEPATQQFKLQDYNDAVKVGNYPLLSGFINCHLKQTRFFLQYYNVGSSFINPPEYFSLPHYPVNPAIIKLGLSIDFIN
ncbi:hypothetical protein M2138_000150 [Dysgonomonadaceae bacterium PH5-43]|nr:hypothetical protein [Dysgonomonadaceae bacterium PH5-43]